MSGRFGCIESVNWVSGKQVRARVRSSIGGIRVRCEGMMLVLCLVASRRVKRGPSLFASWSPLPPLVLLTRPELLEHSLQTLPANYGRRTTRPPLAKHRSTLPPPLGDALLITHAPSPSLTPASHRIKPCQTDPLSHSHPSPLPRAAQASAAPSPAPPLPPPPPTRLPALPSPNARP